MKFIRSQQKKNVQFSKSEIDFLNNFNNFEQFASFSNAFENLYNKILNFAEDVEENKKTIPQKENDRIIEEKKEFKLPKHVDNLVSNVKRFVQGGNEEKEKELKFLKRNEDLLDPQYWSEYASMRDDSDLGKNSGSGLVARYVDRFGPQIADYAKKAIDEGYTGPRLLPSFVSDRLHDINKNNIAVTARNALTKHSVAGAENPSAKQIERQIERTRQHLLSTKSLPTPENVMDSVRLGGGKIDWNDPKQVKEYQDLLHFYENIEKNAPEDLKALSWNNNQRGNTAYA